MFKNKFKNWLRDAINYSMNIGNDVTVDVANSNYQKYQDELKKKRKEYIKTLCNRIKSQSRDGYKHIATMNFSNEIMSFEFIDELRVYFEQRGFEVVERHGLFEGWLEISWQ